MSRNAVPACVALAMFAAILRTVEVWAGGIGISVEPDALDPEAPQITSRPFHRYQVPFDRGAFVNRDIEFLWSDSYRQLNKPLVLPGNPTENDLDRLGFTLTEALGHNPFGFLIPDIRLIYDMLAVSMPGFRPPVYDPILENPGFRVRSTEDPPEETNHVDTYIWLQGVDDAAHSNSTVNYSSYPSDWSVAAEDSVSSYPTVFRRNAFDLIGPTLAQVGDIVDSTRWTRPGSIANAGFNHEFQHALNNDGFTTSSLHMFSSGAEVVAGIANDPPRFDVRYANNLMLEDDFGGNYEAWMSFMAYVAFNYRGVDTTLAGQNDDLLTRWARATNPSGARTLANLVDQLTPAACAECETPGRSYFAGLTALERFHLLLHHWRVALYANNASLAQGQYGFPPQFGFDPVNDVGYWRDLDTSPAARDSFNIPHEFTLTSAHITRERSFAGPAEGTAPRHATGLQDFGADYWVVRSDPSLWGVARDLVVRAAPLSGCVQRRLTMSVIAYTEENLAGGLPDSLWKHPEWAGAVFGPVAFDVGDPTTSGRLEVVIPGFGTTYKAAVAVVTLSRETDSSGGTEVIAYQLNASIRAGWDHLSPNPKAVQQETTDDDWPAWDPSGNWLAFARTSAGLSQIYRKPLDGLPALPLVAQPAGQFRPDWSPRGDWIVFDQETTPSNCNIYAYGLETGVLRRLTMAAQHEYEPAFSPNGQRVAYLRIQGLVTGQTISELAVVDLSGAGDSVLVRRDCSGTCSMVSPKWSPDGEWIYYISVDSLYAVRTTGGLVEARGRLPQSTVGLDVPLGQQRLALSERWTNVACSGEGNPVTRTRSLLHDVSSNRSEVIFSRPAANVDHPRWSFDGTRIAYSSDVLAPGGQRDLHVGQIAFNHAPVFANGLLQDAEVTEGAATGFGLSATDADGEPLTFQAVYLPPGASLNSVGYFYWPSPGPLGAEYYVVFRALDPSGGVDNRVVKYTVGTGSGGGGCPYADTRTESGWQVENSLLARSLTNTLGLDAYRLKAAPANFSGRYHVRLRENEQEYTTVDQVRLVAVDHPAGYETFALGPSMVLGSRVPAARVTTHRGVDVTALVSGLGAGFAGAPGDTLLVEWTTTSGALGGTAGTFGAESVQDCGCPGVVECENKEQLATWRGAEEFAARPTGVALDQAILEETGIAIQRQDGQGGWRTVRHHYPREAPDGAAFDSLGQGSTRLAFVGRHTVRFVGRLEPAAATPVIQSLSLLAARHSRLGNVRTAVTNDGGQSTSLAPGDTLHLEFAAPTLAAGQVREWFLVSRGVYSSAASPAQLQEAMVRVPVRFALGQNQPNPFRATTSIQYELPVATAVRLEVFDAQGRRVRVLQAGEKPAGFHVAEWDRRNASGALAKSGVYLYRMTAGAFREQRKMVLLP